jgi:GNAT superfamily N-acetyltransferase
LAGLHPYDIDSYCLGKEEFIATIDKKTGFNGLRIVKALTTREWDAVHRLRQLYFFDKADPDTRILNHEEHVHFVLFQGSEIIGYAHLQLWPKARAALHILIIDEPKRNHSYGRQLLTLCEKWLKSQGCFSLHVKVPAEALKFYRVNAYIDMPFADPDGCKEDAHHTLLGKIL